ncbi:MAG: hypothetical protein QHH15_04450 [Candidatus Thermoplasmatota archaeon]|nr:hypothetical protein [Candidatus Thermoplasmatota archaeon]
MVKITLDLSKLEIEMFLQCIEMAIDTKYVEGKNRETAKKLVSQLKKYV